MHRFRYGGLNTKGIYVDEDVKRMANTHQLIMGVLIDSLLQQGDLSRALSVCHKWQQELPNENVPYTESALSMARCYYQAHQPQPGDEIVRNLLRRSAEWLFWIETIKSSHHASSLYSQCEWMKTMQTALVVAKQFERNELLNQYTKQYEHFIKKYEQS
jgi:ATP/maltotriose-dependent transcriptional regulator MalT